jgi:N-acyl-L-homoserine lactone synthetase
MKMTVNRLGDKLLSICQDDNILHFYQMCEMAFSDYTSGINAARERGMVKRLKSDGFSIEKIAELTKISQKRVVEIIKTEGLA